MSSESSPDDGTAPPTSTTTTAAECWTPTNLEQTAQLWQLSEPEIAALQDLQVKLADVHHWKNTPGEVVRFLRARPGKPAEAEQMFRAMVEWRIAHQVDRILEDYTPPPGLLNHYPGAILQGLDKEGDPIYVGRLGATDAAGIFQRFGGEEMVKHGIWVREMVCRGDWIADYEARQERPVRRITLIEDLQGLSWAHASRKLMNVYGEIMRLDQDNYPETAKKLIIIRAPTVFRLVWKIAKNCFDPGVVLKMAFCGTSDYKEVLSEYMDLEVLPSAVVEEGKGKAFPGMPPDFEGGPLPAE